MAGVVTGPGCLGLGHLPAVAHIPPALGRVPEGDQRHITVPALSSLLSSSSTLTSLRSVHPATPKTSQRPPFPLCSCPRAF